MALFKLMLRGFEFPARLPKQNANFRFVFQLRHYDASGDAWVTTESVSPGLESYWECDSDKAKKLGKGAKYVRDGDNPRFGRISPWDQVVLLVNSTELFQLRVVVYDVNREDWVDRLRDLGEALIGALVGAAKQLPTGAYLGAPVGTLLEHLREAAINALARKDTVLFSVVYEFGTDQRSQPIVLTYEDYTMRLALVTTGQTATVARAVASGAEADLSKGQIDVASAFAQVPSTERVSTKNAKPSKRRAARAEGGTGPRRPRG